MKKLIIKPNCIKQKDENVEKIIEQWTSGSSVVIVPPGYEVEVVEDGRNEITKFLDQEIEKRKAAVSKQISPTDEIIVGDEVRVFNLIGVVVKAKNYSTCVLTIDRNYITVDKMSLEKTGRNFPQIEEVLEQIRNEDRQSKN